jgi:hypothetical protein
LLLLCLLRLENLSKAFVSPFNPSAQICTGL